MVSKNKKYNDILSTGKELFWKYGFKRVSIEEICTKANVSKMTYYKHFPNKIELAKTIFDNMVSQGEQKFRDIMGEDSPVDEKMKKIIMLKAEGTNDISTEFLQDFYSGYEPELKAFVEKRTQDTWKAILDDFTAAQKAGILRKDFSPVLLIKVQGKMIELLEDESVLGLYESKQQLILELTRLLIYGIAPHE